MLNGFKKKRKVFWSLVAMGLSFHICDDHYGIHAQPIKFQNQEHQTFFDCYQTEEGECSDKESETEFHQSGHLEDSVFFNKIQKIEVLGNSVLSDLALSEITTSFIGKEASIENLLEIRTQITRLYTSKGYTTSAAFIPSAQDISQGTVKVQVVEGKVEEIIVEGLNRLNKGYVLSRLPLEVPFNVAQWLEALQILQADRLLEEVKAELGSGTAPGLNILTVKVKEADSFTVQLGSDNNRTPSVGSNRRGIVLSESNLFGNGEELSASYFNSEGSNSGYVGLTIPITQDGTLRVESGLTDNKIVERPFDVLDLNTESRYYQVFLRQPVLKSPYDEVGLGLIFSRIESESYLDGFRFPLSRGASERGETRINAMRLVQDWTSNSNEQIIFLRSQLSFGLNLDGTSDFEPDSEFFHWNLQGQYLRQLAPDTLFILRGELQQSDQELLPDEQFRAGGGATVRGYREDFILSDNGLWAMAEVQVPVLKITNWNAVVQIAPFISHGRGWNNDDFPLDPDSITSVGVGVRWVQPNFGASLYWGIPLTTINEEKRTLQENGIYFNLRWNPF